MKILSSSTSLVFLFIFLLHISLIHSNPLAPALYVFGDSLFDNGNNNFLPTIAKTDYLPYGVNFARGPTGRFTNNRTFPDIVAEYLGLPYSPPFLSIQGLSILTGFNYASGSCGILPKTGIQNGKCLNLDDQINLFEATVQLKLIAHFRSPSDLSGYLSKSIFLFSIGSNDFIDYYTGSDDLDSTGKQYAPQQFAQLLIDSLSQHFQRLYKLGARKIVMFELGPIGCMPSITKSHNHTGKCVEEANQLASYFNNRLPAMLQNLTSTLQGSMFVLGHVNRPGYEAIMNPSKYSLMDTSNACCTTWENGTSGCIPFLEPCSNPNNHFFFDAYHLTDAATSLVAGPCINGRSVCTPVNIEELVRM